MKNAIRSISTTMMLVSTASIVQVSGGAHTPLLNPDEVIEGKHARFGAPIRLDLGTFGIRDMSYWQSQYMILAGPSDGHGAFKLFRWAGGDSTPAPIKQISPKRLHPEAVIIYPDKGLREFQLLSDDSSAQDAKAAPFTGRKQFRSVWIAP